MMGTELTVRIDDTEAVYPLRINTRLSQPELRASDGAAGDAFGFSLAVSGDTVVVGARFDEDSGNFAGSASVFVRSGTTWTEQAKLVASDEAAYDFFGYSVAIGLDTAVIGAFGNDDRGIDCGSAYVFLRDGNTWREEAKLVASDGQAGDNFGLSVAVNLDTVVAGAVGDNDSGEGSGSAYVFVRSGTTWTEQAKLRAGDGKAGDNFGSSLTLTADAVVVGAPGNKDSSLDPGSEYVFVRNGTTWTEQAKLRAGSW
jgi:hypothetical protein